MQDLECNNWTILDSLGNIYEIQDKVFKNGPGETCGRQPLKNLKWSGLLKHFKIFKGCLPQISLVSFLNTLPIYANLIVTNLVNLKHFQIIQAKLCLKDAFIEKQVSCLLAFFRYLWKS